MDRKEIFTKTAANGKLISIRMETAWDGPTLTVYVDGKYVRASHEVTLISPALRRHGGYPAHITHVVANVGLTSEDAIIVESAFVPLKEAWEQRPEVVTAHLREKRNALVLAVQGAQDALIGARADCFDDEHSSSNLGTVTEAGMADIKAARSALAAWDREHPEIIAQIEAERKADVERHIWD